MSNEDAMGGSQWSLETNQEVSLPIGVKSVTGEEQWKSRQPASHWSHISNNPTNIHRVHYCQVLD